MIVITAKSSHQILKAKKELTSQSIMVELISTPREINSQCGFSLLTKSKNFETINSILSSIGQYYYYEKSNIIQKCVYTKISN